MVNPENMTEEEIEEFNRKEAEKAEKRKQRQANNRRKKVVKEERDPNVIREIKGKDQIECICVRRIGLDDQMSDVGEVVKIPKSIAKGLQDSGAIKVKL